MRARLINETIKHLTPKSDEEVKEHFEEKFKMSYDTFQSYLRELESLGVEILDGYQWMDNDHLRNIEVKSFEVFESSWNVAKCLTKKDAERIKEAHEQYVWTALDFRIKQSYMYLNINELKGVIDKLKFTQK